VGRKLDLVTFSPAFVGMMVFFTASSVGPLITPWEKREKTYERLLSYPVTQDSIILGDIVAGVIFGLGSAFLSGSRASSSCRCRSPIPGSSLSPSFSARSRAPRLEPCSRHRHPTARPMS
jgi:hypothetical protein